MDRSMTTPTLTHALWRQRYLVILVASVFLLAGCVVTLVTPRSYTGTATLFIDTQRTSQNFDVALQSAQLLQHDFIVLATQRPVLSAACAAPGVSCSPEERANPEVVLKKRVAVNYVNGTSMLAVNGKAPTPAEAAALANAVADAMVRQHQAEVDRLLKPSQDALDAQLKDLQKAIDSEQQAIQQLSSSRVVNAASVAAHQANLNLLSQRYASLDGRRQDLRDQHDRLAGIATVSQAATAPLKPSAPNPPLYLLAALAVGLAAGTVLALLRQRFDDRLFSPEDLAAAAGTSTVVMVPRIPHGSAGQAAYSLAHARLLAQYPEMRKILLAAASRRDRSDGPASELGSAAAHAGQRVLLYRRRVSTEANGGSELTGFAPLPNGDKWGLMTVTASTGDEGKVASLVQSDDGGYDLTILAVPTPQVSTYAISMGRQVDHAVLVATAGVTRFADARRSAELLREAGATIAASLFLTRKVEVAAA
jgi:capsular polysaccharide biosynthesis protein